MRWLIIALAIGALVSPVSAQDKVSTVVELQDRVDSLSTIQKNLTKQLQEINVALDEAEALLELHKMESLEAESVILVTNMEASLRGKPSPDGRVLRILPEKTPLVAEDYDGAYWKVRYKGLEGWVMRLFVDEGEDAAALKAKLVAAHANKGESAVLGANKLVEERLGKRFLVTDFGIHPPNSAGGVSIYYAFEHLDSTRTVREVTFSITPYNEKGLKEKGLNSGASTKRLRRFGPISVYDGERQYQFENVWYNGGIQCAQIDRIDIVYTDGSRISHRQDIGNVLAGAIENDCTITAADKVDLPPGND